MPTTPPSLTPAPTPYPQRSDRAAFSTRVDAFVTWLVAAIAQLAALAANVYANAAEVFTNASAAASSAAAAAASSLSANAAAGAQMWVSGNSYGIATGQTNTAWSPTNYLTYRKITALSVSTTDPASDPTNWVLAFPDYKPSINPKAIAQGIFMTGYGSSGIAVAKNSNTDVGTGAFSISYKGSLYDYTPAASTRFFDNNDGTNGFNFGVALTTGALRFNVVNSGVVTSYDSTSLPNLVDGTTNVFTMVCTGSGGTVTFYVNGVRLGNSVALAAYTSLTSTSANYINGTSATQNNGVLLSLSVYNRTLSASEVLSIYNNKTEYSNVGGSQAYLFSGDNSTFASDTGYWTKGAGVTIAAGVCRATAIADNTSILTRGLLLTVGKRYRVTYTVSGYVSGTVFPYFGALGVARASNGTFTEEFVALGTTFTMLSYAATGTITLDIDDLYLVPIGCTAQYDSDGIQASGQWLDSSGNANHGALPALGWSLLGRQEVSKYVWSSAITGDTTLTSIVPAGYELEKIVFKNSTTNAVSVRLGTTAAGTDVFGLTALNISTTLGGFKTISCDQGFSLTAAQTLYLSSTAWGGASLTATLFFRKI